MKEIIVRWIGFLLFISISILLIKLFIWLLPILFGLAIGYYIYKWFKEKTDDGIKVEKASKNKKRNKKTNKKIVIIDEVNHDE